jgi:protein-tyrosine phosphatase
MRRIAFICHGNICRSVMAEYILQDLIEKNNIKDIHVDSFAVSYEEIGNTIYPYALDCLKSHNIKIGNHKAKRITQNDYYIFDEFYYMDDSNKRLLNNIINDSDNKIHKLLDRDVSDPWYTGDFEKTYADLLVGINNILNKR